MTTETFNEEVKSFEKEICRVITLIYEKEKEIAPMILSYKYKKDSLNKEIGILGNIGHLLVNEQTKTALKHAVRDTFEEIRPLVIAFVSEGSCTKIPKKDFKNITGIANFLKKKKESKAEEKIEIVTVNFETANSKRSIIFKIDRSIENDPKLISDEDLTSDWIKKDPDFEGLLDNFLDVDYHPIVDLNSIN